VKVRASFITSAVGPEGCPADGVAELALVGRSNVGKSTLVNALARTKLARTSAAPGKTRLINVYRFEVDGEPPFHLVDLPGYGYARGGEESAETFELLARSYFENRARTVDWPPPSSVARAVAGRVEGPAPGRAEGRRRPDAFAVLQLIDSRHPGLPNDMAAHDWLTTLGVPVGVVATKVDKLSRAERSRAQQALGRAFTSPVVPVAATTGEGLKELWILIRRLLSSRP
jgi:GTP-binding protein